MRVYELERFLIILIGFFTPFFIFSIPLLSSEILLLFLAYHLYKKDFDIKNPYWKYFIALFLMVIITGFIGINPSNSIALRGLFIPFTFFAGFYLIHGSKLLDFIVSFSCGGGTSVIYAFLYGDDSWRLALKGFSSVPYANVLAVVFIVSMFAVLYSQYRRSAFKYFLYVCILLIYIGLLSTTVRGAIFACLISTCIMFVLRFSKKGILYMAAFIIITFGMMYVLSHFFMAFNLRGKEIASFANISTNSPADIGKLVDSGEDVRKERIRLLGDDEKASLYKREYQSKILLGSRLGVAASDMSITQSGYRYGVSSFGWRLVLWKECLKIFKENPVFGIGQYNLKTLLDKKYHNMDKATSHAHSIYFQTLVSYGLFGVLIFFILFVKIFADLVRFYIKNNIYAVCGICLLVFTALAGVTEALWEHGVFYLMFFLLLGVCLGSGYNGFNYGISIKN